MDIDAYQHWTRGLVLANALPALAYDALGLCDEAGEVVGKVKKLYRDDGGMVTPERQQALKLELGDALWYLVRVADDLGISMSEVIQGNVDKLESRKVRGVQQGDGDNR